MESEPEPMELSEPSEQMELDLELEERPQETIQVDRKSSSNPALPLSSMMAPALGCKVLNQFEKHYTRLRTSINCSLVYCRFR